MVLGRVREKYPSLDVFLEHTRFNVWRQATGHLNIEYASRARTSTTRFKLASTLAVSLLELHTVRWVRKSLMSSSNIMLPETMGDADADTAQQTSQLIREPFLVGFNHGRPSGAVRRCLEDDSRWGGGGSEEGGGDDGREKVSSRVLMLEFSQRVGARLNKSFVQ
ncbi:hypothetical protein DL769_009269 [Monosporascus sp. CRB-8-3]|nr:hypothetical protein DL769_009269 [Monosporascus sp. CRB-8-3]